MQQFDNVGAKYVSPEKLKWKYTFLLLIPFLLCACNSKPSKTLEKTETKSIFLPHYSKRFKIDYYENGKEISVLNPANGQVISSYFIDTTISKIICLSTTHIAALSLLNSEEKIQAVANTNLIYNTSIRAKIVQEKIASIGLDYNPDIEKILRLKPQIVFTDAESTVGSGGLNKLKQAGIEVVISNDYKEQSPLARAEWLYYFAAFVNQEKLADSIFKNVEKTYSAIKSNAPEIQKTVFCNQPYQGIWYMPSKESYTTELLHDAGGNFLWKDAQTTNGLNLSLNYEQVFQKAQHASVWLLFSSEKSREELKRIDSKLQYFDAFQAQHIYAASKRTTAQGGTDYWESGCWQPQLVLNDLRHILQGEANEDSLIYFQKLK